MKQLIIAIATLLAAISIFSGCTTVKKVNQRSAAIPAYEDMGKGFGRALEEETANAKWIWK